MTANKESEHKEFGEQKQVLEQYCALLETQEELLQFSRFTNTDAWDLGSLIVSRALSRNLKVAVSIRQLDGFILFQGALEGSGPNNAAWMERKFNTVRDLGHSSLLTACKLSCAEKTLEKQGLHPETHVACGGGFPVKIAKSRMVAVALVSGLPHLEDHDFLSECLGEYLGVSGFPRLPRGALVSTLP